MATDLRRAKSTAASKYDSFVSAQLARAENRIRLLDLMSGLLGCTALGLAYIVAMVLCDSKLMLSQETRQLALYLFLAGGTAYLFHVVVRPLRLRVNPYYAARQVEQQLPHAKNSIVNWVDLHEQQLPPAILGALGQRAAKDMSHVDVERVISGRRAAWMGGFVGLLAVAFIVLFFLLGPAPFLSLLKRTFNPFGSGGVSTRTQLTIHKPEGGNAAVTVGRGINFVVEVNGKVPDPKAADAVKLLYRYEESDPWLERRLIQEPSREWSTALSAIEVRNGFWYKITGGDAATEEYQVAVRAAPAITDFLATYHFRPYVARADEVHRERELKALRGTEVLLRVRTNRTLRDGRLEFEGRNGSTTVRGEVDPKEPHTLFLRFVLEEDGKYRLFFTSTESEAYTDAASYPVTAIPDQPPHVELTKPGQDISLPADALLHVEGKASDDIGVKTLTLQMRVVGGQKLRGQRNRGEDALRLADGGYAADVEYEDFVELSRVQDEMGQAVALRAGMELEYWLEASDACDFPHANVGASKHYRVLLTEQEKNEQKSRREKQQAAENKKQHEQKQDQKLREENRDRQQQRKEQEARNQEEENKSKDADKGGAGDPSQSKEGGQQNNGASNDNNGQKGDSKDGSNEQSNGGQKGDSSSEAQKIEDQIKKALDRKQASEDAKSEAKPDKGEDKGAQSDKSEGSDKAGSKPEGGNKGADKQDAKEPGEGKDNGEPKAGADPGQAEGKGDKQANPAPDAKSEPKDGDPMKNGAGDARESNGKSADPQRPDKGKGKSDASSSSSEVKPSADPQASKDAAQDKSQPKGKDQDGASEGKDKGKSQAGSAPSKDGKGGNQSDSKPGDKSELKDGDPRKPKGAGENRENKGKSDAEHRSDQDKGKSDAGRPSSEGKPNGDPQASKDSAEAKSQSKGKDQDAAGDSKPSDAKEQKTQREPASEAKDKNSTSRGEAKDDGKRKDDSKTEAKNGDSSTKDEQSTKGDPKPSRSKDKDDRTAKGESKPDPDAEARKATKKDIDDLDRSLKGKDAGEREKAKRQLERIKKQAENLQAREKARETLEKGGAPDGTNENRNPTSGNASSREPKNAGNEEDRSQRNSSSSSEKRSEKDTEIPEKIEKSPPFEPTNENKDRDRSPNRGTSGSKKGGKSSRSGEKNGKGFDVEPKNESKDGDGSQGKDSSGSEKSGESTGSSGKNGQGSSPRSDEQGSESSAGGNRPGGGGERRSGQSDAGNEGEGMDPQSKPAKPRAHRTAQMQLEEFAKKVNKDILKEAGVSEEAWKKYLESRRKQLTPREQQRPEAPSAPQQGSQLPSMGGRTIQPSGSGPGDAHGPDRGQPPPGYRDPFREFTRQMSEKKK